MTFRQLRESTFLDVHLDPDGFAERLLYFPVDGSPRAITAHVEAEQNFTVLDTQSGELMEQQVVSCSRDPQATSTCGVKRSGIDRPRIGDELLRSARVDPRQEPYTFTGEIRQESRHKWRLVFQRRARTDQGFKG